MKIWVIKTGEPIPYLQDERKDRFLRAGQIVRHLHEQGHEVTWWTGSFDHMGKCHRTSDETVADAPKIELLPSQGYIAHIGLARILDHRQVARAFRECVADHTSPDLILCAYPTPNLCVAAVEYGRAQGVPVVLDVRDLWPDIFDERLRDRFPFMPRVMRRLVLSPYKRMAHIALGGADGVISLTEGMLSWAQDLGRRNDEQRARDSVFHQSRSAPVVQPLDQDNPVARYLSACSPAPDGGPRIRMVWVGSIIPNTDGETLLRALEGQSPDMRAWLDFTICGRGALAGSFEELAARCENVTYFEWLDNAELTALLVQSHIGLMCYLDRPDFQMSIPNKVVDYLSAGMRILTNLTGELARLCKGSDTLLHYQTGSERSLLELFGRIVANPALYRMELPEAYELFSREFDAENILSELEDYLVQLAASHPSKG